MSSVRVIQRSPDFGLRIRLQRLPAVVPNVAAAVVAPEVVTLPPWWWGYMDESDQHATTLEVTWDAPVAPTPSPAYWPGLWVAVVEGATEVTWEIEFTPTVWVKQAAVGSEVVVAWQGETIGLQLPHALPATPEVLFPATLIELPNPLNIDGSDVSAYTYWSR